MTRENCEEKLATAHHLSKKCENLVYAAAKDKEDNGTVVLLIECKRLLTACDILVALVEDILRQYDLDTNTSVTAQCS